MASFDSVMLELLLNETILMDGFKNFDAFLNDIGHVKLV
jgi:hypothetical protein